MGKIQDGVAVAKSIELDCEVIADDEDVELFAVKFNICDQNKNNMVNGHAKDDHDKTDFTAKTANTEVASTVHEDFDTVMTDGDEDEDKSADKEIRNDTESVLSDGELSVAMLHFLMRLWQRNY